MYDHEDQFALGGLCLEQSHHIFRIRGGKAGGGLVQEKDGRLANELEGDVESFALPSADALIKRGAHLEVANE